MPDTTPQTAAPLVESFSALNIGQPVLEAIAGLGYARPTPVQAATIPLTYAGIDLIVQSQTGTGKTAAFAIPVADMLRQTQPESQPGAIVECLVLTPTRELAKQVCTEFERVCPGLPSTAVYGGTSYGPQLEAFKTVRVIAATPGRLLDHLRSGNLKLDNLKFFILDEADEMLSMGFQEELDAIVGFLPERCQSLLFSATVNEDIKSLAGHFTQHPEYVTLSSDSVAARSVEHLYFSVSGMQQTRDLVTLIEAYDPDSALIFCNTRDETVLVASHLQRTGYTANVINGDLPQSERERALATLKEGGIRFLVATDVAARGIDISGLPFVINYHMPISAESYIHRTGRTGRAGKSGVALSLMTPREIGTFYQLMRVYHIDLEERALPTREELNAIREARAREQLLENLREDSLCRRHAAYQGLAERIGELEDGQELVARLVAFYQAARRREEAHVEAQRRTREASRRRTDELRDLQQKLDDARETIASLESAARDTAAVDELQTQLRDATRRADDAEGRLAETERKAADSERKVLDAERSAESLRERVRDLETARDMLEKQLTDARARTEQAAAPQQDTASSAAPTKRDEDVDDHAARRSRRRTRRRSTRRGAEEETTTGESRQETARVEPQRADADQASSREDASRGEETRTSDAEDGGTSRRRRRRRGSRRRGRSAGRSEPTNGRSSQSVASRDRAETPPQADASTDSEFATIAVSVERSLDEDADSLREMVCYMAGVFPEDLGTVSRSNGQFLVNVRADYAHDVVEAIDGQAWKGRRMRARPVAGRN